jgi:hypothetical protein
MLRFYGIDEKMISIVTKKYGTPTTGGNVIPMASRKPWASSARQYGGRVEYSEKPGMGELVTSSKAMDLSYGTPICNR